MSINKCECVCNNNITNYFASALFNARELVMNNIIEEELSEKGYRVFYHK
jgi:hypothetical protein